MLKRIDHIGIAVYDLEAACKPFEALGLSVSHIQDVPGRPVRAAFLRLGESELELLQPVSPGTDLARFLGEHGEGIHHICFEVDHIETAIAEIQAAGLQMRDQQPRQGASGRIAFLDPHATHGVLIEIVETR